MRRLAGAWRLSFLLAGSAWGCYEIPPSLPEGYVGSAPEAPGWPPPAAYHAEPLHPLNRWFHRAFSARDSSGALAGVDAADPLPRWKHLRSVDLAELAALTEILARERPAPLAGAGRQAITDLALRSDALQVAAWLEAEDPATDSPLDVSGGLSRRLVRRLLDLAGGTGAPALESGPPEVEPPPLRQGQWDELALDVGTGLQPQASDLRWTRVLFCSGGLHGRWRLVFLRLRVLLGPEGEPELVPLASECWEVEGALERKDGEPAQAANSRGNSPLRLWLWDRARWAAGEDPWRECAGAAPDGGSPGFLDALSEAPRAVAAGRCREYAPRSPPEPAARAQLEQARESLRRLLGGARNEERPCSR